MGNLSLFLNNQPEPESTDQQLRTAMSSSSISPPAELVMDGHLHRFSTNGQSDDTAGWYVVYPGVVPAGAFGDWRLGETYSFHAAIARELSGWEKKKIEDDVKRAKEKAERERAIKAEEAARASSFIWEKLQYADASIEYLTRKHILAHNSKMSDGKLVLPLYDISGKLSSLQFVSGDGTKKYKADGVTKGCFWQIGSGKPEYMAEGFATAASISEATGKTVIIAYSAGNLAPVAMALKQSGIDVSGLTIIADNDDSETGEREARKACDASGCRMKLIPVKGMDANDYAVAGNDLKGFLEGAVPASAWFKLADDYISQPVPLRWLIRGWLQQGGTSLLHAQPGAGKTFLVLDWLLSIAQGEDWHGCRTSRSPVAYLCGEGHTGLHARLALWKQEHHVSSLGQFAISQTATDIDRFSGITLIHDAIEALPFKPAIVAIDTLNRFMFGDENSAQDTRLFLNNIGILAAEYGCHFLIVQHEGLAESAQGRARGSSAWRGAVDNEFSLSDKNGTLTLKQCKMKDARLQDPMFLKLDERVVTGWFDEDKAPVSSMILVPSESPSDARSDQKKGEDIDLLKGAWLKCSNYTSSFEPCIYWTDFRDYLVSQGMSAINAKNALRSDSTRMMGRLLSSGTVRQQGNQYIISDPNLVSILTLLKKGESNDYSIRF